MVTSAAIIEQIQKATYDDLLSIRHKIQEFDNGLGSSTFLYEKLGARCLELTFEGNHRPKLTEFFSSMEGEVEVLYRPDIVQKERYNFDIVVDFSRENHALIISDGKSYAMKYLPGSGLRFVNPIDSELLRTLETKISSEVGLACLIRYCD